MISIQSIRNKIAHMRDKNGRFAIGKEEFFGALTDITDKLQEVNDNTNSVAKSLIWQSPVANVSALATTYPNPQRGWAAMVESEGFVYSWNGEGWKNTGLTAFPRDVELKSRTYTQLTDPALESNGVKNGDTWIYTGVPLMRYERIDGMWINISGGGGGGVVLFSGVGFSYIPGPGTAEENGAALEAEIARVGALETKHTIFLDDAVYALSSSTIVHGNTVIKTMSGRRGATLMASDVERLLYVNNGAEFQGVVVDMVLISGNSQQTEDYVTGVTFRDCMLNVKQENSFYQHFYICEFYDCEIIIKTLNSVERFKRLTYSKLYNCKCDIKYGKIEGCAFRWGELITSLSSHNNNSFSDMFIRVDGAFYTQEDYDDVLASAFHRCIINGLIQAGDDGFYAHCYGCYFDYSEIEQHRCKRYSCFVADATTGMSNIYIPLQDIPFEP